ncbi:hypothetical protein SODALDRAFT_361080 [Sodiomyces alkalinus F11]|uniref:Uncharacterized protein n=1 Tax=Sodiomyces alkalinus (strain CBS 110278 / VKM F-3762 / F11) TaxID=1314773 RepID=A0A3N2PSA2_SODAK|nr:hypothetical protein SODALDRAFT_361080 [Sodiomyces alkalinus F11]ROT37375.1 hypothetical protein SODALDRAFT_361080 [Sodiomyces alkalinus F11]
MRLGWVMRHGSYCTDEAKPWRKETFTQVDFPSLPISCHAASHPFASLSREDTTDAEDDKRQTKEPRRRPRSRTEIPFFALTCHLDTKLFALIVPRLYAVTLCHAVHYEDPIFLAFPPSSSTLVGCTGSDPGGRPDGCLWSDYEAHYEKIRYAAYQILFVGGAKTLETTPSELANVPLISVLECTYFKRSCLYDAASQWGTPGAQAIQEEGTTIYIENFHRTGHPGDQPTVIYGSIPLRLIIFTHFPFSDEDPLDTGGFLTTLTCIMSLALEIGRVLRNLEPQPPIPPPIRSLLPFETSSFSDAMASRNKLPAPLDLSRSKTTTSSPRMNLRRAASYNNDKQLYCNAPLSATSSRFSFNHLLFASPPPSPSLPALVPRPRKSPNRPRPSRVLRVVFWLAFVLLIFYFATISVRGNVPVDIPYISRKQEEFEMVGQDELPDFATPIVVTGKSGRSKWTVSIPAHLDFPLSTRDYGEMCSKCREVASRVRDMRNRSPPPPPEQATISRGGPVDRYFLDVQDAEKVGLLPGTVVRQGLQGNIIGVHQNSVGQQPICESSITFVLETADPGIGHTIMELWIFYGLAMKQGRAFFIDDTRWAYGKYTDIFRPPPLPNCRPPPRHQMLPCPAQARHLVVSPATARELWTDALNKPHLDLQSSKSDSAVRELFDLAHKGYQGLFDLNEDDAKHVMDRANTLKTKAASETNSGKVVGMHVRHGDRHPLEYQYRSTYIPMSVFTERANELVGSGQGVEDEKSAVVVVASDDPLVYEAGELSGSHRAQEQIRLASKPPPAKPAKKASSRAMHRFEDEAFGWEGGFFGSMFWGLGASSMSSSNAATTENMKLPPSEESLRLRSYIGRAYVMDLAVLARSGDYVICTVSAMGCRLLAVMMGWESAMKEGRWVNVDGDYGWTALAW